MNTNGVQPSKQRGHSRSASLENASSFIAKNTLGLPIVQAGATGTLKSRNEQKHLRNKFGSHNNLEDYVAQTRSKFQNIRQMFESNKYDASVQLQPPPQQQQLKQQQQQQQQQEPYSKRASTPQTYSLTKYQTTSKVTAARNQDVSSSVTLVGCGAGTVEFTDRLENIEVANRIGGNHETGVVDSMNCEENEDQATNLIRPIAFKPIPFEPDYSIPHRCIEAYNRYGSTPSLVPVQGSDLRFGSTSDLRHGSLMFANSLNSNSLVARRRCSRSMKTNDSMDSDSDVTSQSSTLKSLSSGLSSTNNNNSNNKYMSNDQFDMTPSPSDSGISELEAALKDRDSELSYLRQTMEHNEKDKEEYWENETKRLKGFYENQQRDYLMKIKKMEQMFALQSFQFKQNKLRMTESLTRLKDQFADIKTENEMLRSKNENLKTSDRAMKERVVQLEEKTRAIHSLAANLKSQLEENEWTVCQKNGEIALLKSQLKEANMELTMKEYEIVQVKQENNSDPQIYQSIKNPIRPASDRSDAHELSSPSSSSPSSETEISQLNKIIILKDQVILALTNELGKLRKELSDLAIFHEYGEEPSGKLARLKYQIENLSHICNKTKKLTESESYSQNLHDTNLELIMNCLKITPSTAAVDNQMTDKTKGIPTTILPAVVQNHNSQSDLSLKVFEPRISGTAESVSASPKTNEVEALRNQLNKIRADFEMEKRQWAEEKDKVLSYQRQLQMHYINMYHKMISLDGHPH